MLIATLTAKQVRAAASRARTWDGGEWQSAWVACERISFHVCDEEQRAGIAADYLASHPEDWKHG